MGALSIRRMPDLLPADAHAVLDVWFGDGDSANPEWFRKDPVFDVSIRTRFGAVIRAALAGELADWDRTPLGALARIVVLDQFTRNAFRGQPQSFAGDERALRMTLDGVKRGHDAAVPPMPRIFCYLPLEHAEDAACQARSVALFQALCDSPDAEPKAFFDGTLDYARKHQDVIQRFGRFPHRNPILGRASTPDELAYLAQPGAGF